MRMRFQTLALTVAWAVALPFFAAAQAPTVAGCPVFPANSVWNTPVPKLPVDANSAAYITTIGASKPGHPDFGSGLWDGGPIGIPFATVPGSQAKVAVTFDYDDESDHGGYPVPANAPIEGGSASSGDRHVLIIDTGACVLYELYSAYPNSDGSWHAGSGAIFDLKGNALRPTGWTSADAAGLPIFPGLVRYDEVAAGEIRHALRFTAPQTRNTYIWPARHKASSLTGAQYPPMGQRFRLRADFDVSSFSTPVQVILRALKTYGMILADNGSSWYISGAPDDRWDNDALHDISRLRGSDFEAVDETSLMSDANSAAATAGSTTPPPAAPVLSSVVNGGSHLGGALAPGEIVTLMGQYFGTNAASTGVWFDQHAAPLLFVQDNQIGAVVPYGTAKQSVTQVHLTSSGVSSNTLTLAVAHAAPGIYIVLNQDFTINSPTKPVPPGGAVVLYATGEGQTIPAGQDGKIAGTHWGDVWPKPVLHVAVEIGGQPAQVLYAGAAPGFIAGAMQVNALVPAGVPKGSVVQLVLTIGGFSSQAVTVAVGR
jgi:uncharacterized protein (TIGR03437 family)